MRSQARDPIERQVAAQREFYTGVVVFLMVNAGLFVLNWLMGAPWWAFWVMVAWGFGILVHGVMVFVVPRFLGPAWEARTRERLAHRR